MRGILIFLLAVGLGLVFLHQKKQEAASAATKPATAQAQSVGAKQTTVPQLTPAPRGQASQYNYMKRALDRAADVRDQARAQTKASQDP
jgi:LPS O-antigen subunit length determinant protein (WzzB/FepE family)